MRTMASKFPNHDVIPVSNMIVAGTYGITLTYKESHGRVKWGRRKTKDNSGFSFLFVDGSIYVSNRKTDHDWFH